MTTIRPTDQLVRAVKNGVELSVIVLPCSSRNTIVGLQSNSLKIKISKPPVDGAANDACCRLLADHFNLPASKVTVVRGHNSRRKTIRVEEISAAEVQKRLKPLVNA